MRSLKECLTDLPSASRAPVEECCWGALVRLSLGLRLRAQGALAGVPDSDKASHQSSTLLRDAISLFRPLGLQLGCSRDRLQAMLSLLEPDALCPFLIAECWASVLGVLRCLSWPQATSGGPLALAAPLDPPYIQLQGGARLASCRADAGWDAAETVRKCVKASSGATLGVWLKVHSPPSSAGPPAVLWKCWESRDGGWELQVVASQQDAEVDVLFVRLGPADEEPASHGDGAPEAPEEFGRSLSQGNEGQLLATLPAGSWTPCVVEIQPVRGGAMHRIRVNGTGEGVEVDSGPRFPAPDLQVAGVVEFFGCMHADVAALWLVEGACGAELRSWLDDVYKSGLGDAQTSAKTLERLQPEAGKGRVVLAYVPACAGKCSGINAISPPQHCESRAATTWGDPELGACPVDDTDLCNLARPALEVHATLAFDGNRSPIAAARSASSVSQELHACFASPGWVGSLLWALARALPRGRGARPGQGSPGHAPGDDAGSPRNALGLAGDGISSAISRAVSAVFPAVSSPSSRGCSALEPEEDPQPLCTRMIDQTLRLILQTITCLSNHALASTRPGGAHFLVDDGAFAVWSYLFWRCLDPRWIGMSTCGILRDLLRSLSALGGAGERGLAWECWSQLFGPHMAGFWCRAEPEVQQKLWEDLYEACARGEGFLDALGGAEGILFSLSRGQDTSVDVFCIRLLLALEHLEEHSDAAAWPRSKIWPWLVSVLPLPHEYAHPALDAVKQVVLPSILDAHRAHSKSPETHAEMVFAISAFCEHPCERVRASAVRCLRLIQSVGIAIDLERLRPLVPAVRRAVDRGERMQGTKTETGALTFNTLWDWLQGSPCTRPALWDRGLPLVTKVHILAGRIGRRASDESRARARAEDQPLLASACVPRSAPLAGSQGQLFCLIAAVLDAFGDCGRKVKFVQRFTSEVLSVPGTVWWREMQPHVQEWHPWLLGLAAKVSSADFLVVDGLHSKLVSQAFVEDADGWRLVQRLVRWTEEAEKDQAHMVDVGRTLLVSVLKTIRAAYSVSLRDAAKRGVDHFLGASMLSMVRVLFAFLHPRGSTPARNVAFDCAIVCKAKKEKGADRKLHPSTLRLASVVRPASSARKELTWLDYAIGVQLLKLWETFLIRDPLHDRSIFSFDAKAWTSGWQRRPSFPLDGVTEQFLLHEVDGVPLFTHLLHWGTRCLLFWPPYEQDHASSPRSGDLTEQGAAGHEPQSARSSPLSPHCNESARSSLVPSALSSSSSPVGPSFPVLFNDEEEEAGQQRGDVLRILRHLTLCLLAIGTHSGGPVEGLGIATISFCCHALNCADRAIGGKQKKVEARGYAVDVLLLLIVLWRQKMGNSAERCSQEDVNFWSENGHFPFTVLKLLPRLNTKRVAEDVRNWAGDKSRNDPVGTMQKTLLSFMGNAPRQSSGTAGAAKPSAEDTSKQFEKFKDWGFTKAANESQLAAETSAFLEVHKDASWATRDTGDAQAPLPESSKAAPEALPPTYEAALSVRLREQADRASAAGRRSESKHRQWTIRAWRTVCRTNRAPGSMWRQLPRQHDHHAPPPKPDPRDQPRHSGEAEGTAEDASGRAASPWERRRSARESRGGVHRGRWWRRSFASSTLLSELGHRRVWAVDRLEDDSGRRSLLVPRSDPDDDGAQSSCSSMDSSASVSASTSSYSAGSSDCASPLLQTSCTWVRREYSCACRLRLYPDAMQLKINSVHGQCGRWGCSPSGGGRHSPQPGAGPSSGSRSRCAHARGGGRSVDDPKRICGRRRSFALRNLQTDGVHPRSFLHRPTALELHFADGTAPVRLHFDKEEPPPSLKAEFDQLCESGESAGDILPSAASDGSPGSGAGYSSSSAAAVALLGRTIFGSPTRSVSTRDLVWLRLHYLQRRAQESSGAQPAGADARSGGSAAGSTATGSWARGAGCRQHPATASAPSSERSPRETRRMVPAGHRSEQDEVYREFAQTPSATDIKRLRSQHSEAMKYHRERQTERWLSGNMSNFAYLQFLNFISGRSAEDLSQYPVAPWVLGTLEHADAPSTILAHSPGEVKGYFRDLSRTMGALGNSERRAFLEEKYDSSADMDYPPYHHGTHYSTPAFVIHFLIRAQPFSTLAKALQGGKYDIADRLFFSVPQCWRSCSQEHSDVRELIPELFTLPECLINISGYHFGDRQDGGRVHHVELPAWAKDAYHFVHEHRLALESMPVSVSLNQWIDLVWGHKQTGAAAKEALNVFYPLTYADFVDWDQVEPSMRHSREQQVLHFGQTPTQVFVQPHPVRRPACFTAPSIFRGGGAQTLSAWHSSVCSAGPAGFGRSAPHNGILRMPMAHAQTARVLAIGMAPAIELGEDHARLLVVQGNGLLKIFRAKLPRCVTAARREAGMLPLFSSSHEPDQLHLETEASFKLPDVQRPTYALWNRLMVDPGLMQTAACWAFIPRLKFFVRGGYRDGSFVFGYAKEQHASVVEGAHEAPVTAIAVSQECACYVPRSHGLLVAAGTSNGEVSLWAATEGSNNGEWKGFAVVSRWPVHTSAVSCVEFEDSSKMALSAGADGIVHLYRIRPPTRPLRSFVIKGRAPVAEARFGSRAPCTVVACSVSAHGPAHVCVWALHGFLLAEVDLRAGAVPRGLRVVCDADAREGLLCITDDGHATFFSLPYLHLVWQRACHAGTSPTVLDTAPSRYMVWIGHQDGTFEAIYATSGSSGSSSASG